MAEPHDAPSDTSPFFDPGPAPEPPAPAPDRFVEPPVRAPAYPTPMMPMPAAGGHADDHEYAPSPWDDGPSGATIVLAGGQLVLNKSLTIDASALPGGRIALAMKPALPLARAAGAAAGPGSAGDALKAAMEVKEILVRAPWGEIARARMEGPLGTWTAELRVPEGFRPGPARLEIVASDAAGNVSRRYLLVAVGDAPAAPGAIAATLAAAALGGLGLALHRRARRRPVPAA